MEQPEQTSTFIWGHAQNVLEHKRAIYQFPYKTDQLSPRRTQGYKIVHLFAVLVFKPCKTS